LALIREKKKRFTEEGTPKGWEKGKKTGWPEGVIPETYLISYFYDGNGNLIKEEKSSEANNLKFTTTFGYDFENRLISVSSSPLAGEGGGEGSVSYSYDGDGNRISKTDSSGTIKYINDIALPLVQVIQETDALGNLLASYTIGNDLISRKTATETIYYHSDALGSIRQLTDPTQTVIATYLYDAFGNLLAQTGTAVNPYLFTGEQFDSLPSLYYLRARYYDPSIGRFISRDPILSPMQRGDNFFWALPYLINQPQNLHPYIYVTNSPINYTDPYGLIGGWITLWARFGYIADPSCPSGLRYVMETGQIWCLIVTESGGLFCNPFTYRKVLYRFGCAPTTVCIIA